MFIKEFSDRIRLCLIDNEEFKSNYFSVSLMVPLSRENVTMNALFPSVLMRGSREHKDMRALSKKLLSLYGANLFTECRKKGDVQVITFGIRYLKDKYTLNGEKLSAEAFELLRGILTDPFTENSVFSADYVEQEKKALKDRINAKINDKRVYAVNKCIETMCQDEAFGLMETGYIEDLDAITPESLFQHYRKMLKYAQIYGFMYGECDETAISEFMLTTFDGKSEGVLLSNYARVPGERVNKITETMDVSQSKLVIGYRAELLDRFDIPSVTLFNVLFGSGPTSKLFENVREKLSLCYYCVSRVYRAKSIMLVDCGIESKNIDVAIREISSQLADITDKRITEHEWLSAQKLLRNHYMSLKDSYTQLEEWYINQFLNHSSLTPESAVDELMEVSVNTVSEIAAAFKPDTIYFLTGRDR